MGIKLLVTTGPGLQPGPDGYVLVVDWQCRRVIDRWRFTHSVYRQSHKGLAGASVAGGTLLVAAEAELLKLEMAPLRLVDRRTFRFLNDVHHISVSDGRIWVCNTGLDCLEEFDAEWRLVQTHDLIRPFGRKARHLARLLPHDMRKSWRWMTGHYDYYQHLPYRPPFRNVAKLLRPGVYRNNGRDLRKCDFRPHFLHPNYICPVGDDIWVTLFFSGEVVSLKQKCVVLSGLGRPHDGVVVDGWHYVTDCAANRVVVRQKPDHDRPARTIAERRVTNDLSEGFLRGICPAGEYVFVGLTARRGAPDPYRAARIVMLHAGTLEFVDQWVVPEKYGLGLFSIVDVTELYR